MEVVLSLLQKILQVQKQTLVQMTLRIQTTNQRLLLKTQTVIIHLHRPHQETEATQILERSLEELLEVFCFV
jgi:hypothetical protein